VTVKSSDTDLVTNMETFVANYNKFRDRLNDLTQYDLVTETKEILAGDATARRFEEDMARAITQRYFTGSSITTLRQIGVTLKDDGTLSFDSAAFKREYKADPQAVRAFFTTEGTGFSEVMDDLTEGLAGAEHSLWSSRNEALDRVIAESEARIEFLTQRLQVQRERLLLDFYNMEIAISNIQSNLTAIKNIGYIAMPDKN